MLFNQVYECHFFEDQVYDWGRFQKIGSQPVPKLPQSNPPPPPRPEGGHLGKLSNPHESC